MKEKYTYIYTMKAVDSNWIGFMDSDNQDLWCRITEFKSGERFLMQRFLTVNDKFTEIKCKENAVFNDRQIKLIAKFINKYK